MKKKQYFYKGYGRRIDILSINTWLRGCKDYSYWWDMSNKENVYGVKTYPKHKHRRSITSRLLKKLCGYTTFREESHRNRFFLSKKGTK